MSADTIPRTSDEQDFVVVPHGRADKFYERLLRTGDGEEPIAPAIEDDVWGPPGPLALEEWPQAQAAQALHFRTFWGLLFFVLALGHDPSCGRTLLPSIMWSGRTARSGRSGAHSILQESSRTRG